ncbi:hypothetical protein [Streptomyces sp. NPDC093589]|uniref:hypothetical protein n=1 Tax=Streptomyces sp. NPDC093589 TaxID=3366043 RepID=UPI00380700CD
MKYAKSAAVVAGSVMALGAASPAFAVEAAAPQMSLNGGLTDALNSEQMDGHQFAPLVDTVKGAADKVKAADTKDLLGGAQGVGKSAGKAAGKAAGKGSVKGAAQKATPLLGGLPLR